MFCTLCKLCYIWLYFATWLLHPYTSDLLLPHANNCPWFSNDYAVRRLLAKSREVLKPRDWMLSWSYRSDIWQASQQRCCRGACHYNDVIMGAVASQITSLTIVYSTVYSGADQRKHQSSASVAFVRGIHRWPENSPHKGPVTGKMFSFDDVIMR